MNSETLAQLAALWRESYSGRELYRVAAGPGWLRLHLAGDDHVGLFLTDLPGARLAFSYQGRLPDALTTALAATHKHPLQALLAGKRLDTCGVLTEDKVLALRFTGGTGGTGGTSTAGDVVLLAKFFGAQGNLTLIDRNSRLLWSVHRPPHTALSAWPAKGTWQSAIASTLGNDHDAQALAQLTQACADILHTQCNTQASRLGKAARRLVDNLHRDLRNADQGDIHRQKAEALAASLHTLSRGLDSIELASLDDGTALQIKLDPALMPAQNMEAWFRRARKARKGLAIIQERHAAATEQVAMIENARESLAEANDDAPAENRLAALQKWRSDHPEFAVPKRKRAGGSTSEEPARPFRRYLIDGVWEVWVGRNNKENDELTHRAAHNRDLWLHAQGVAGSHVIIRAGGQPERISKNIIEKAAALAALHSKAKNAQHAPVIYTEKRYVRKPRKAPAGTATCLRDQSIFVEPGIMPGVEKA